ncbi:Peptidase M23 [Fibrisoma limi BUZ 3]|uniref:Peptidase M23 n=1 Tax=Fibrisoma limi BUZ 3 TaxID=1185876 RepID=I2GCS9_9BACT|nr:M23 family metallopeptidase [Fibrisoma limi]CCH51703.1 Peptidase M23 [Fibrisoma limi BUZ 3]
MRKTYWHQLVFCGLLLSYLSACTGLGPATNLFRSSSPHEQYAHSLKEAKLDQTALGIDWLQASEKALRDSLKITTPYRESGYFSASKPFAVGYRIDGTRGDRFIVQVETQGQRDAKVFIDVFELGGRTPDRLASSKADTNNLVWEVHRTQTHLIRVQPELLRSGRYTISITREPALSFPVQGLDSRRISSYFGAPRDGGRRRHEGIDIFAPRGTPAVAAANGVVTGVGTNNLGGNVVFLSDNDRNLRLYYAHLDRFNVTDGQRVSIGDTLGFVGNTGNARTTAPHLHFGIYQFSEGAVDPLPFVRLGRGPAKQSLLAASRLGDSMRISTTRSPMRSSPGSDAPILRELTRTTAFTILGGTATWLRVELPDGLTGYLNSNTAESATRPLRQYTLPSISNLLDAAAPTAGVIDTLPTGTTLEVLATYGQYLLVRSEEGLAGWIARTIAP